MRLPRLLLALSLALCPLAPSHPALAQTTPAALEPDGNDEPAPHPGPGLVTARGTFTRVGRSPLSHPHLCDLTVFSDALYLAYARRPLGSDGATLGRYQPADPAANDSRAPPFTVAFDWNRRGQPANGGGAGQGFSPRARHRRHPRGARRRPPVRGLRLSRRGGRGLRLFLRPRGPLRAPPRGARLTAPAAPAPDGSRPGASVLPRAYHVLDVISYRGHLYASTGSVPPGSAPGTAPRRARFTSPTPPARASSTRSTTRARTCPTYTA